MPFLINYRTNDDSQRRPQAAAQQNASSPAAGSGLFRSPEVEKMAKAISEWASTHPARTKFAWPAADEGTAVSLSSSVPSSLPHFRTLSPDQVVPREDLHSSATDPHQLLRDAEVAYMDDQRAAAAAVPQAVPYAHRPPPRRPPKTQSAIHGPMTHAPLEFKERRCDECHRTQEQLLQLNLRIVPCGRCTFWLCSPCFPIHWCPNCESASEPGKVNTNWIGANKTTDAKQNAFNHQ